MNIVSDEQQVLENGEEHRLWWGVLNEVCYNLVDLISVPDRLLRWLLHSLRTPVVAYRNFIEQNAEFGSHRLVEEHLHWYSNSHEFQILSHWKLWQTKALIIELGWLILTDGRNLFLCNCFNKCTAHACNKILLFQTTFGVKSYHRK